MSQSRSVDARVSSEATAERTVETEQDEQCLLKALDDDDCRDILDATGDSALSANEVSDCCDLPLSTTYRKLEMLTDAGLLVERTRIQHSGKHVSEFVLAIDDVTISVDDNSGVQIDVSPRDGTELRPSL